MFSSWNLFLDTPILAVVVGLPVVVVWFGLPIYTLSHCWQHTRPHSRKKFWAWTAFIVLTWYFVAFGAFVYSFMKFGPRAKVFAVIGVLLCAFIEMQIYLMPARAFVSVIRVSKESIEQSRATPDQKRKMQADLDTLAYDGLAEPYIIAYLKRILADQVIDDVEARNWRYVLDNKDTMSAGDLSMLRGEGELPALRKN